MITEKIREILKAYTEAFPPSEGCVHTIHFQRNGSDGTGYVDQLILTLEMDIFVKPIVIEEGDFDKPTDQILAETKAVLQAWVE